METTELDLDAPGGELFGAIAYLAVLAYPESPRKRNRTVKAMLALMNRGARHLQKPLSPIASELFFEVPPKRQAEILGQGQKGALPRIYRRIEAAKAASLAINGISLNHIAARYDGNESYFLHTVWSESKPVLHLAMALLGILRRWQDDGRPVYIQLLARPSWIREAMRSAESWRRNLSVGQRMSCGPEFIRLIDPDAFVRLVPADHSDSPTTPQ